MAWGQKYQIGWYDLYDNACIAKIYKNGWTGGVTTLYGSGDPASIDYQNDSDDVFSPIKATQLTLNVVLESNFQLSEIISGGNMDYYVELFLGDDSEGEPHWTGFIDPSQYKEPYDVAPYEASIVCVDGLTYLSNYKFEEELSSDTRLTEATVIYSLLGLLGCTEFNEYLNIYETNMDEGASYSPLAQAYLSVDVFKGLTALESLQEILKTYNACIRQKNGVFCLYRPIDLILPTVAGRKFTGPGTYESISMTPLQYISRGATPSNIRQVPGGSENGVNALHKVTITQDFGDRASWFKSYEFDAVDYDKDLELFPDWTDGGLSEIKPIGEFIAGEDKGVAVHSTYGDSSGPYLGQTTHVEPIAQSATLFTISIDMNWYNGNTSAVSPAVLRFMIKQGSHYLKETTDSDTDAEWTTTPTWIGVQVGDVYDGETTVPVKWGNGWYTWKRQITGLEEDGEITIWLGGMTTTNVYACFKDVVFKAASYESGLYKSIGGVIQISERNKIYGGRTQEGGSIKLYEIYEIQKLSTSYEVENTAIGDESSVNWALGDKSTDNLYVLSQFKGIKAVLSHQTLTQAAMAFVTNNAATWLATDVDLTRSAVTLYFTAHTAGNNFTGSTSISNLTGNLSGTVTLVQANSEGQSQIIDITVSGTNGTCDFGVVDDYYNTMTFSGSIDNSIDQFILDYHDFFNSNGYTISRPASGKLRIEGQIGVSFTTYIQNLTGDLTGAIGGPGYVQFASGAVARIDSIELSGTNGSASITCDGVTRTITILTTEYNGTWLWFLNGESSGDRLIALMAKEQAFQASRVKQFIQMNIQEMSASFDFDVLGCIVDILNSTDVSSGDAVRKLVFNRGTFNIRNRTWQVDLVEIVPVDDFSYNGLFTHEGTVRPNR